MVEETVIHVTNEASWLPSGSRAEVVRLSKAPHPMSVVRLLLRREDEVFCTTRGDTGRLDLPMRITTRSDLDGSSAIRALTDDVVGRGVDIKFLGAVRNVVDSPRERYDWPTPFAHFGVWASGGSPLIDGEWVSLDDADFQLSDRHWYPLVLSFRYEFCGHP